MRTNDASYVRQVLFQVQFQGLDLNSFSADMSQFTSSIDNAPVIVSVRM